MAKEQVKTFNYNLSDKPKLSNSSPFFMAPTEVNKIDSDPKAEEASFVNENPLDSASTLKQVKEVLKKDGSKDKPFSIFNLKGNTKAK